MEVHVLVANGRHRRQRGLHRKVPVRHRKVPVRRYTVNSVTVTGVAALGVTLAGIGHGATHLRPVSDDGADANSPYFAATPYDIPLTAPTTATTTGAPLPPATARHAAPINLNLLKPLDIPPVAAAAYVHSAALANASHPGCNLPWQLLAAIGDIESGHARSGGSLDPKWNGEASPAILGPVLDGSGGFGAIPDTDHGRYDGNVTWDRAVGPMQFIPSTWAQYAADGNGDHVLDPENIWDATLAAGDYLCTAATRLDLPADARAAIYSYNHSDDYVQAVLTIEASYRHVNPAILGVLPSPSPAVSPSASRSSSPSVPAGSPSKPDHSPTASPPSISPDPTPSATPSASPTPSTTPPPSASPSSSPSPSTSRSAIAPPVQSPSAMLR